LGIKEGYSRTCSHKCGYKLRELEYFQKYGVKNQNQLQHSRNKAKKTIEQRKINDPDYLRNIVEQRKMTCLERYGVDNYRKTPECEEKNKKTCLEKYGVESSNQSLEVQKKQKATTLKNYGVDNISKHPDIKKKKEETCKKNYGESYIWQTEEYKNRFKENHNHHDQLAWSDYTRDILLSKEKLTECLLTKSPIDLALELEVAWSTVYNYAIFYGIRSKYTDFSTETLVQNILNSYKISYVKNDRQQIKPKELDFYLPEYNIGIEICGLYWHSERAGKDKNYHIDKLNRCDEKGIRLITIFEDELKDYDKIQYKLKNILGKSVTLTGARKCEIKEITSFESKEFFNKYHLQNNVNGKIYLGAFFQDKLVAAMSFGELRASLGSKTEKDTFEMLRYACSDSIPGIGSKLLTYFIRKYNPTKIISYCDRRWSIGNFYKKLGFIFEKNTTPNYWYMKNHNERQHRFTYTKQKLIELGGDPNLTEWENAQKIGLDRIWDCGSSKWVWEK
jgi:hypothetical protein